MNKNNITVLLLFFSFITFLYLTHKYKKDRIIKNIIDEWIVKTKGGFIKLDDEGNYKGHYYLSVNSVENRDSHIHLIVDDSDYICYIIKKDNNHSKHYCIKSYENIPNIVEQMIEQFINFNS
jgi:hypothetical protein